MSCIRPALAILAVAGLLSSACDTTRTTAPQTVEVAPVASTPTAAVKRMEWAFNHSDVAIVAGLLSGDFEFQGAGLDSAGNGARDPVATRDSLLAALRLLFEGGPGVPAPASVHLSFDQNLIPFNDPRAGKHPKWHKAIRTSVDLVVVDPTSHQMFEATGHGLLYLTRGDSAAIPADEVARGASPDSTRWWIDRWEDETIGVAGGAHANPATRTSVWAILRFFRDRLKG